MLLPSGLITTQAFLNSDGGFILSRDIPSNMITPDSALEDIRLIPKLFGLDILNLEMSGKGVISAEVVESGSKKIDF